MTHQRPRRQYLFQNGSNASNRVKTVRAANAAREKEREHQHQDRKNSFGFIKLVASTRRDRGRAHLRTFLVAVVIAGKIEMEESGKPYAALT